MSSAFVCCVQAMLGQSSSLPCDNCVCVLSCCGLLVTVMQSCLTLLSCGLVSAGCIALLVLAFAAQSTCTCLLAAGVIQMLVVYIDPNIGTPYMARAPLKTQLICMLTLCR